MDAVDRTVAYVLATRERESVIIGDVPLRRALASILLALNIDLAVMVRPDARLPD